MKSLWLRTFHPISAHFRRKRFQKLLEVEPALLQQKILDLGGSVHFWQKVDVDPAKHDITILNVVLDGQATDLNGEVSSIVKLYDGHTIPYPDWHFDWVLCNSVIEHVPLEKRERFASELQRVGRSFIVQTPAYAFPVEPHFVMPFLHWLPRSFARRIAGFGLWGILGRHKRAKVDDYFGEVHLLKRREFAGLFPAAALMTERFAGIPKSYTLISARR